MLNDGSFKEHSAQQHSQLTAAVAACKPQLIDLDYGGKVNPEEYDMMMELVDKGLRQASSNHDQRLHSLALPTVQVWNSLTG